MKVEKKYIIEICNLSHPDFGVFAKFLDGLGKDKTYIEVPQPIMTYLCDTCARPLWLKNTPCGYCKGLKDGQKENLFKDHTHTWTVEEPISCINCGIWKSFLAPQSKTN